MMSVSFEYTKLEECGNFLTVYQSIMQTQTTGTGSYSIALSLSKIGFKRLVLQSLQSVMVLTRSLLF